MDKLKFERIVGKRGDSLGMTIPTEILDYLQIKEGDKIFMTAENGKHGNFVALFKE